MWPTSARSTSRCPISRPIWAPQCRDAPVGRLGLPADLRRLLLVRGRIADLVGRRKVLIIGFAIFAVCTLVDAVAVNAQMLVTARAVQGIGAAATIPPALGILTATFTEASARSRAVAAFWRRRCRRVRLRSDPRRSGHRPTWLALGIRTTVAPAVLLLGLTFASYRATRPAAWPRSRVDVIGALTATTGLLGLMFALTSAAGRGGGRRTPSRR